MKAVVRVLKLVLSSLTYAMTLSSKLYRTSRSLSWTTMEAPKVSWTLKIPTMIWQVLTFYWCNSQPEQMYQKFIETSTNQDSNVVVTIMASTKARRTWCSMVLLNMDKIISLLSCCLLKKVIRPHWWRTSLLSHTFLVEFDGW